MSSDAAAHGQVRAAPQAEAREIGAVQAEGGGCVAAVAHCGPWLQLDMGVSGLGAGTGFIMRAVRAIVVAPLYMENLCRLCCSSSSPKCICGG
jgi:hypothetical protein